MIKSKVMGGADADADKPHVNLQNKKKLEYRLSDSCYKNIILCLSNKIISCGHSAFIAELDFERFIKSGKLPFTGPSCEEALRKAKEVWSKGDTIFNKYGSIKDEYKELSGADFINIPFKVKSYLLDNNQWKDPSKYNDKGLSKVLNLCEQNFYSSYKNRETYPDEMACVKALFVQHFDEIQQKEFYNKKSYELTLHSIYSYPKIKTLLALVVFSGSKSVLEGYLEFIKSKGIKISMNDQQMEIKNQLNFKISKNKNNGLSYTHSPMEYLTQCNDLGRLKLFIACGKEVDENGSLDRSNPMLMASYYGHIESLKTLKEPNKPIISHAIMHLIDSGHVSLVLQLLKEGFIDQQKLIIKDNSVGNCVLANVFIALVDRYMSIIAPSVILPLSSQQQEELKLLGKLLEILIAQDVDILEKDAHNINILARTIFSTRRVHHPISLQYINDLTFLLSRHPKRSDFETLIREVGSRRGNKSKTLLNWGSKYGSLETKKLLGLIPTSS